MSTDLSSPDRAALAQLVDHTLLKPEATPADVAALVAEAHELEVLAVCVSPSVLPLGDVGGLVVATVAYFVVILGSGLTADERSRVFAFIPLFVGSAVFWSLYQQQFTVLTLYADERLDRNLFGWTMPVPWVQSINPVFIILLAGVFAAIWTKLGRRQPPTHGCR